MCRNKKRIDKTSRIVRHRTTNIEQHIYINKTRMIDKYINKTRYSQLRICRNKTRIDRNSRIVRHRTTITVRIEQKQLEQYKNSKIVKQ